MKRSEVAVYLGVGYFILGFMVCLPLVIMGWLEEAIFQSFYFLIPCVVTAIYIVISVIVLLLAGRKKNIPQIADTVSSSRGYAEGYCPLCGKFIGMSMPPFCMWCGKKISEK